MFCGLRREEGELGGRASRVPKTPELGSCLNSELWRARARFDSGKSRNRPRQHATRPTCAPPSPHQQLPLACLASPRIRPRPRPPPLLPPLPAAVRRHRRLAGAASRTRTAVASDDDPMTMMTPPPLEVRALLRTRSLAQPPRSPRPVHPRRRADRGRSGSRQGLRAAPDLTPQPALFPPRSSSRRTTRCWCRTRSSLLLVRKPPHSRWKVRT